MSTDTELTAAVSAAAGGRIPDSDVAVIADSVRNDRTPSAVLAAVLRRSLGQGFGWSVITAVEQAVRAHDLGPTHVVPFGGTVTSCCGRHYTEFKRAALVCSALLDAGLADEPTCPAIGQQAA